MKRALRLVPPATESGARRKRVQYDDEPGPVRHEPQYAMTHEEIAAELGVCRERVRQLEHSALRKLRRIGAAWLLFRELKS